MIAAPYAHNARAAGLRASQRLVVEYDGLRRSVEVDVVAEGRDDAAGGDPEARLDHAAEHDPQPERACRVRRQHVSDATAQQQERLIRQRQPQLGLLADWKERVCNLWGDVRISDIAADAGVSRQAVYKEVGAKDQIAGLLIQREVDRFLAALPAALGAGQ